MKKPQEPTYWPYEAVCFEYAEQVRATLNRKRGLESLEEELYHEPYVLDGLKEYAEMRADVLREVARLDRDERDEDARQMRPSA